MQQKARLVLGQLMFAAGCLAPDLWGADLPGAEGSCAAEPLLVSPWHKGSIPALPPRVAPQCVSRTDLTFLVLWGDSHPRHKLGGTCKGGARTECQARALPLLGHQHSTTRRKPRRNCSGTLVLVLTSRVSSTFWRSIQVTPV